MARAHAAVVLALTVCCCLLAVTASARSPVDLPPQLSDHVEPLLSKPVAVAGADEAADQASAALAAREEEGPVSSLLCLVFRCGDGEPAGAGGAVVARDSSQEQQARPAVTGTEDEEASDGEEGPCNSDSDCDSDSDDEDEGGIVGWFWRLAHGF